MANPTVVFIESNTTGTGGILLAKALQAGYRVAFLAREPERYSFLTANWHLATVIDTQDLYRLKDHIASLAPKAILSTSEYFLETAAHLADHFGLPGANPKAIERCRNKAQLMTSLAQAGVPTPKTAVIQHVDELGSIVANPTFPLIVKPAQGSGSVGVRLCHDPTQLREHVEFLLGHTRNERGLPVLPLVLVQEYLDGNEYSVEVLGTDKGFNVLGITRKYLGAAPHFVEIGHDFPADLDSTSHVELSQVALAGCDAAGLHRGPAHVELRLVGGRASLIEINPRLAGGMIPELVRLAQGCDPLDALLTFALTGTAKHQPRTDRAASIRFVMASGSGTLQQQADPCLISQGPGVSQYVMRREIGSAITLHGDFRDRIGWVICQDERASQSSELADAALAEIVRDLVVTPNSHNTTEKFNKQSRSTLHPTALAIVRKPISPQQRHEQLQQLATLDQAHVVMLAKQNLLTLAQAGVLLEAIDKVSQQPPEWLLQDQAPRGTYLLYEDALIQACGLDLGGAHHLGRSRNDLNATLSKLNLRDPFRRIHDVLWRLRLRLIQRGQHFQHLAMPIYSQYQQGLPGTYGFYLAGIEEALSRDQRALFDLRETLDHSPLGAGAGAGTTVPIDPEITAALLGFQSAPHHALDTVASRDLIVRFLGTLTGVSLTVSRCLHDFQLWTTREFNFLTLPDQLTGGSSMMPQKRNPYLLEMAQGRTGVAAAAWQEAYQAMLKTPFSNSVQVGTEALKPLQRACLATEEAIVLLDLHVAAATPNEAAIGNAMVGSAIWSTGAAETLAMQGSQGFREVHTRLSQALATTDEPAGAIASVFPDRTIELPRTTGAWAERFRHGGGPGNLPAQWSRAEARLNTDGSRLRTIVTHWSNAAQQLADEVTRLRVSHQETANNPTHLKVIPT